MCLLIDTDPIILEKHRIWLKNPGINAVSPIVIAKLKAYSDICCKQSTDKWRTALEKIKK